MSIHPQQRQHIANVILGLVLRLKEKKSVSTYVYEFFEIDEEYDVEVTVKLTAKKSQYERGMEMFK